MCGRYAYIPDAAMVKRFEQKFKQQIKPNYNVAPMQSMPIETSKGLELMQWGLVPSWSKDFRPSFSSINARAETLAEKPLYRTPFEKRRCLVPATAFYEWQQLERFKQPYCFKRKDGENFNFAGLYDIWYDGKDTPFFSYTIITTSPNSLMKPVHDRMPVILDADEEKHWLDNDASPDELQLLLDSYSSSKMVGYEVDRAVGNVKNNTPELLEPLKQ